MKTISPEKSVPAGKECSSRKRVFQPEKSVPAGKECSSRKRVFQPEILVGWKEIAAYLRKGVRTVQRYERESSLPVRRPTGKLTGSVLATKDELDAWVAATPFREVFRLSIDSLDKIAIDTRAVIRQLSRQLEDLRQLRQASAELRAALHESVEVLQKNLNFRLREKLSPVRDAQADVLSFPSKKVQ